MRSLDFARIFSVLAVALVLGVQCLASQPGFTNEGKLQQYGYALTPDGMKDVLTKHDALAFVWCIGFIVDHQYTQLAPDIIRFQQSLDPSEFLQRLQWIRCTECLFAVDKQMPATKLTEYIAEIRRCLFLGKTENERWEAYRALQAAHQYKGVDIKDDLLRFVKPDAEVKAGKQNAVRDMFRLYGDELSAPEIIELRDSWKENK